MSDADSGITKQEGAPPVLVIRNEEDAWKALQQAVSGYQFPDDLRVRFDGWPVFQLDVKGRDWHSTVPTRIMPSLLEVQRNINRAYAHVAYSDFNLRRLHDDERDDLEIVVKVEKGSSLFDADLGHQLGKIADAALNRMNGTEAVIAIIGVALTIMAPVMFKAWLAARQKAVEEEARVEISKHEAAVRVELSSQETARMKIMAEATARHPQLETVREDAHAASNKLLKATRPGDTMTIKGIPIPAEEAHELVQPDRELAKQMEFEGAFVIHGNRTDRPNGFRITVERLGDGLRFAADVKQELPWDQQRAIQQAEWLKHPVQLVIDAEIRRDKIIRADVISAKTLNDSESS